MPGKASESHRSSQPEDPLPDTPSTPAPMLLCSVHSGHSRRNMGERRTGRGVDEEEWIAVLRPAYAFARHRHAKARAEAYDLAQFRIVERGLCGPDLRITDLDDHALTTWERSWLGTHPSGAGGWNWRTLLESLPRRAAVLPVAIWYGNDLCGLALGQLSRRRFNGSRHTVTLTYVERPRNRRTCRLGATSSPSRPRWRKATVSSWAHGVCACAHQTATCCRTTRSMDSRSSGGAVCRFTAKGR